MIATCPHCRSGFYITPELAGKTTKCSKCKEQVRVPDRRSDTSSSSETPSDGIPFAILAETREEVETVNGIKKRHISFDMPLSQDGENDFSLSTLNSLTTLICSFYSLINLASSNLSYISFHLLISGYNYEELSLDVSDVLYSIDQLALAFSSR